MRQKVVILGAGVAGLSAAQELIDRDFEVHVFERREISGGKAASTRKGAKKLPAEHGFRFFPSWYRHLSDTMKRIPYQGRRVVYEGGSVYDNLVSADVNLMAWYGRDPTPLPMHLPRTGGQLRALGAFVADMQRLGLAPTEISFFIARLAAFMTMSEAQRVEQLQNVTWWDYVEADTKSTAYQNLILATTRTMVAAKAKEACAYTIGKLAVRTLFDTFSTVDRVLNGPTSEVWFDPWIAHLRKRGVHFHFQLELDAITFAPDEPRIESVSLNPVIGDQLRRLRRLLEPLQADFEAVTELDARKDPAAKGKARRLRARIDETHHAAGVMTQSLLEQVPNLDAAVRTETSAELWHLADLLSAGSLSLTDEGEHRRARAAAARHQDKREDTTAKAEAFDADLQRLQTIYRALRKAEQTVQSVSVVADHFIFALPLEQMAYYINRSAAARTLDPSLERIVYLAESSDWMGGVQFYLQSPVELTPGHLIAMDSEWALTAIEQSQFWRDVEPWPTGVQSVISVDVAAWDRKGRLTQKPAYNCSNQEIAQEVWAQLCASVNRKARPNVLSDDLLVGKCLKPGISYHIDDSIVDLMDRKKQGAYERARSVQFSAVDLLTPKPEGAEAVGPVTPYVWGPRLRFNAEPLLINRVGSHKLRPDVSTGITNMYLAADYVRTETDLACMEGANEAARRAVNALLDTCGSTEKKCELWHFTTPSDLSEQMLRMANLGDLTTATTAAIKTAGKVADGAMGLATQAVGLFRGFMERK